MSGKTSGWKNKKILITCGPTWIPIDDMRVISNQSTGELGQRIAQKFLSKDAKVTLLEGPVKNPLKIKGIKVHKFQFFDEFARLLRKTAGQNFDIIIHAAAVSDYQLAKPYSGKISSGKPRMTIALKPTAKLIHTIKKWAPDSLLVGFKLESSVQKDFLIKKAAGLCQRAKCAIVVANTTLRGYKAYIIDNSGRILASANSKAQLTTALIKILEKISKEDR